MPPTAAGRHLALGDRVEDAASVFGPLHDDLELSSYAAFEQDGAGLDHALLDSVGLVAGDGLERALRGTLARRPEGEDGLTILLGLPADLSGIEQVRDLAETLGLALRTEVSSADGVVLRVCPDEDPGPWEVPAPEVAQTSPAPSDAPVPAGPPAPADEHAARPRLRQLAVLGALGLLVVLAVAVVLLITVGTGAAVVLLLLAVLVAVGAGTGLTLVLLRRLAALEARLDADLRGDQAAFRRQLRTSTERLQQRQQRLGQAARERHEALRDELHVTQERVTALGVLTARLAAREDREPGER